MRIKIGLQLAYQHITIFNSKIKKKINERI
jgi:hypothetical protein